MLLFLMSLAWVQDVTLPDAVDETPLADPINLPMEPGLTQSVLENGMSVTVFTDPDMPEVATLQFGWERDYNGDLKQAAAELSVEEINRWIAEFYDPEQWALVVLRPEGD